MLSQEPVVGSAQGVVVARARAPRDAAVQHCLERLDSQHPNFLSTIDTTGTEANNSISGVYWITSKT